MFEFNENGLYKMKAPSWEECKNRDPYWCQNWTFRPVKNSNGEWYMHDTYYNSWGYHNIKVTEENVNDFKFVFDFREVKQIPDGTENEYNESDLYMVATNSGGYSCGNLHWVKKDAKRSIDKLIAKQKRKVKYLESDLKYESEQLKKMESGEYRL